MRSRSTGRATARWGGWRGAGRAAGWIGAAVVVACSSDSNTAVNALNRVALIAVSLSSTRLTIGQQAQANVTLKNSSGVALNGKTVTWASANSAVASVDASSGMVTAVGAGSTTITARSDGSSGSANVDVVPGSQTVAGVHVTLSSSSLTIGATSQATAVVTDGSGAVMAGKVVTWTSGGAGVATVDGASGLVTAIAAGTTLITATADGVSGSASVGVAPIPVASVAVAPSAGSIAVGATTQATATARDASGIVLTGRPVAWSSSDPAVATVDGSTGIVTGVAAGTVQISATSEGKTGSSTLQVTAPAGNPGNPGSPPPPPPPPPPSPVATVAVSLTSSNIVVGGSAQGTATTKDASGNVLTGRTVTWTSSDPSIAAVSSSGLVSGVAAGTATITATSEGKTGTASITVAPVPVATVSVSLTASSILISANAQATAITRDATGAVLTGRAIAWSSSNTSVATVSSTGLVTGIAAGSATIRATSEGQTGGATITITVPPPTPVATVTVALSASSIVNGATTQATATTTDASGNVLTGRAIAWSTSNAAVATVSASGLVTGVGAGAATITATSEGKSGGATVTVTLVPVATVSVSLGASSVVIGLTIQATATARDASGTVLTGRAVTWSSSNTSVATVTSAGVVTGVTAGTATITATSEGKTGSATVTVTAPPPVATQLVVTTQPSSASQSGVALAQQPSVQLRSATNGAVSQSGVVVTASIASGTVTLGGTATATTNASGIATFSNLALTGSGAATLRFSATGLTAATSSAITVSSGSSGGATVLFQEHFDDTNFGSRGWYDLPSGGMTSLSTTDHILGSTASLQVNFAAGATGGSPRVGARHLFTPSTSVYATYWIKYSSNWVGSGESFHPHEFHLITTEDDQFVGPAVTHLTTYMEENFQSGGGYAVLKTQDASNIDATRLNQDLTNVTESRAVSGCNGNSDGTPTDCYLNGSAWNNEKTWKSASPVFLQTPGSAGYKGDWHQVAVYFQMNSIVGGKGQNDGVAQYWFDGQLVIDQHHVLFRTGAHPNMLFNQFLMAPYIGDGSPIAQTMWIDDLSVSTAPPG